MKQKQDTLIYLCPERWNAIFNSLGKEPSFEIIGEVVGGKPITEKEFCFVYSKLNRGNIYS